MPWPASRRAVTSELATVPPSRPLIGGDKAREKRLLVRGDAAALVAQLAERLRG